MITTPYEELSEGMRRYYCEAAQKAMKRRRVTAIGRRWFRAFAQSATPEWFQVARNKSESKTAELHCRIDLSKMPKGTREVVVVLEDVP